MSPHIDMLRQAGPYGGGEEWWEVKKPKTKGNLRKRKQDLDLQKNINGIFAAINIWMFLMFLGEVLATKLGPLSLSMITFRFVTAGNQTQPRESPTENL